MYKAAVCILSCLFAWTMAFVGENCASNDVCGLGECCQILSPFRVVSKRLVQDSRALAKPKKGTCQKYQLEGETCGTFDKMNGYCSCEPGTTCHTYEVPLDSKIQARRIAAPRPGYQWISKCEKPAT